MRDAFSIRLEQAMDGLVVFNGSERILSREGMPTTGGENAHHDDKSCTSSDHHLLANAASKATSEAVKSNALMRAQASRAPNSRSIPPSSHSTESGPR